MIRSLPYYILLWLLIGIVAGSCGKNKATLDKRHTYSPKQTIPYATLYAYQNLKYIFPEAEVKLTNTSPSGKQASYTSVGELNSEPAAGKIAQVFIAGEIRPDQDETDALLRMVGEGQHLFISSHFISRTLLDSLRLKVDHDLDFENPDSLTVSIKNPVTHDSVSFAYPGSNLSGYFSDLDTSITTILGKDIKGRANFVQFNYTGGGTLYIHLVPMAFTNFFLLHKNNKVYYDYALSYLPRSVELVKYDEYFRRTGGGERNGGGNKSGKSSLSWLMNQKGFAAALGLLVLLLILIFVFESKRKQRIIPIIPPVRNASLDFVKTIGRLYYQRRDNKNLAQKMTAHFLDQLRTRYNIRTGLMDEEFEKRLAWKSGYDITMIKDTLYYIKQVQDEHSVSDDQLLALNAKLEKFNQN